MLAPTRLSCTVFTAVLRQGGVRAIAPRLLNVSRALSTTPPAPVKLPTKEEVVGWGVVDVQKFAVGVLGFATADSDTLGRLGISGRALLGLGATKVGVLMHQGLTLGAALALTQTVETLRGAHICFWVPRTVYSFSHIQMGQA